MGLGQGRESICKGLGMTDDLSKQRKKGSEKREGVGSEKEGQ